MAINLRHPALLAPRKKSQRALVAVRTSPTLPGRFRTRANNTPPARSTALRGAPLATNGVLLGEMLTWLGLTTGARQSMRFSEEYRPWISTVNIRQPPSLVHNPTTHHVSIRINHSSTRHCEMRHQMTAMAVPRANYNLSRTWTSVVISSPETHRALLAHRPTYHLSVMDYRSQRGNSNMQARVNPTIAPSRLQELGIKRNAFSTHAHRIRVSTTMLSSSNQRHRGFRVSPPFRRSTFSPINSRISG